MNKIMQLGFLLMFFCANIYALDLGNIDSLEKKIKTLKETERLPLLNEISYQYRVLEPKRSIEYGEEALNLARIFDNRYEEQKALDNLGLAYRYLDRFKESIEFHRQALEIAQDLNDPLLMSNSYNRLGIISSYLGAYTKSLEYFNEALKIREELGDQKKVADVYNNKGMLLKTWGYFDEAMNYFNKALLILNKTNDKDGLSGVYENVGMLHKDLGNYEQALDFYRKSLMLREEQKERLQTVSSLENIASCYVDLKQLNKALEYYREAISILEEDKIYARIGDILSRLGAIYKASGKPEMAEEYLANALKYQLKGSHKDQLARTYFRIADLKMAGADYEDAIKYLDSSYASLEGVRSYELLKDIHQNYALVYEKMKDAGKALGHYKQYSGIKDSMLNERKQSEILKWQVRMEYDKLMAENDLNVAQLKLQRRTRNIFIFIGGVVILFIIFIVGRYHVVKKLNGLLTEKAKELSEQKNLYSAALEKIKDNEGKLRSIFDSSVVGIGVLGTNKQFVFINHTFVKMIGYDIGEVYRLTNSDIMHLEDRGVMEDHIQRLMNKEIRNFSMENRIIRKDGSVFWGEFYVSATYDDEGNVKNIISIIKDTSEAKEIEKANKDSLAFLEILIETIPSPVFYKDKEGRYIGFNSEFLEAIGKTKEEVLGKTMYDIAPDNLTCLYHEKDLKIIQSGGKQVYEADMEHADGSIHNMMFHKSVFKSNSGEVAGIVGIMVDVTDMKRLEEKHREAREKAETTTNLKSMFLADMSHEIRTPMNGIIGMVDILMHSDIDKEQKEYLDIINISSQNLLNIIDDILDFSKIESGQVELENIEFDPVAQVEEVVKLLRHRACQKRLKLSSMIALEVPRKLYGDPYRLKQVLINLVNNAIKFTPTGSVKIEVILSEQKSDQSVLLFSVVDTGIGLDKEERERLFKPFSQAARSTSRKYGGTGLGLGISKNLVSLMRGDIGVKSIVNEGSTFWFTAVFKNELNLNGEISDNKNEKEEIVIVPSEKQLNVLVAEDDFMNQRFLTILLGKMGHTFDVADDGLKTVEKFQAQHFDCILMDIDMPELDGLGATRQIREIERQNGVDDGIKIIAVTAKVIQGDRERCIDAGMNSYISKPFKSHDLQNVMQEVGLL